MPPNFEHKFGFSLNDTSFLRLRSHRMPQTLEVWALHPYPFDIGVPLGSNHQNGHHFPDSNKPTVSHSCHGTHYTGIDSVVQRSQLTVRPFWTFPNFFSNNHFNNAGCWLSIHLRDMLTLEKHHPEVANEFQSGNFVVQKSYGNFPAMAIDQALEQTNTV